METMHMSSVSAIVFSVIVTLYFSDVITATICESPQFLKLYERGIINCKFDVDFFSVLWYNTAEYLENDPVLDFQDNVTTGVGYESGEYGVYPNGSLIINYVTLQHDVFTVAYLHTKTDAIEFIQIQVIGVDSPDVAFPVIALCGNDNRYCYSEVDSSPIKCLVSEVRPAVMVNLYARTIHGDMNISSEVSVTADGGGYTSSVTSDNAFHYSPQLALLVCKASSPSGILENTESMILVKNRDKGALHGNSTVRYFERDTMVKLYCSDKVNGFVVWKKVTTSKTSASELLLFSISIGETVTDIHAEDVAFEGQGSLVIPRAQVKHEGRYACIYGNGLSDGSTVYDVNIIVYPETTYPLIDGCDQLEFCVMEVQHEGILTCSIEGIRPLPQLKWQTYKKGDVPSISFSKVETISTANGETFKSTLITTYSVRDVSLERLLLECVVSEPNASFRFSSKVYLQFTKDKTQLRRIPSGLIDLIWVVVMAIGIFAVLGTLIWTLIAKKRRSLHHNTEMTPMTEETPENGNRDCSSHPPVSLGCFVQSASPSVTLITCSSSVYNLSPMATTKESGEMDRNLWHGVSLLRKGHPSIYKIKCNHERIVQESSKIRKCEIGSKNTSHLSEKVIMFVGETGAGKTTMINRVVNYLLGVQWEDEERYKLVLDEEEEYEDESSQTQSKTKWITSYTFNQSKLSSWRITLIDTPGFNDTGGKERDKFLTNQIKEFFKTRGEDGIDHIDAVGFVLKANSQRLTESQVYIFNFVLRLFGKDISQNIFLFATYADKEDYEEDEHPAVIEAVKKANVPYHKYYMFNNLALFRDRKGGKRAGLWGDAAEDLGQFFRQLETCEPKSIYLSAEVLSDRAALEILVKSLPARLTACLVEVKKIEAEEKALEIYRQETEDNKDFTYTVYEQKKAKKDIGLDRATVCTKCFHTCHYPCLVPQALYCKIFLKVTFMEKIFPRFYKSRGFLKSDEIHQDQIMCYICPGKCSPDDHKTGSYVFESKIVEVVKTRDDIQNRYLDAREKVIKTEYMINKCKEKLMDAEHNVANELDSLRSCLNRLDEIALKPDSLSVAHYLDDLIKDERDKGELGWENRVEALEKMLRYERAVTNQRSYNSPSLNA